MGEPALPLFPFLLPSFSIFCFIMTNVSPTCFHMTPFLGLILREQLSPSETRNKKQLQLLAVCVTKQQITSHGCLLHHVFIPPSQPVGTMLLFTGHVSHCTTGSTPLALLVQAGLGQVEGYGSEVTHLWV